jgi:hypothetical protein
LFDQLACRHCKAREVERKETERKEAERKEAERKETERRKEAKRESLRKEGEGRKEAELQEVNIKLAKAVAEAESVRKENAKAVAEAESVRKENTKALSDAKNARQDKAKAVAEAEKFRQEKDKAVAAAANARQEKDKAVSEVLGERQEAHEEAREADAARKKAEAEANGLRLELDGARLRELQPITHAAVRAVLDTPEGLPGGFMRDDESEILVVLKTHNSKERDAPVELACDLGTQYFCALDNLVNCRMDMEKTLLKSEGEQSSEVLESTKLRRDATYQDYLAVSKKLLDACNAGNGMIGRVQQRNETTKACADRLFQLVGESVGVIAAMNQPHVPSSETRTLIVETLAKHDAWVANKLAQSQELCVNVRETMTKLAVLLKAYSEVLLHCDDNPLTGALLAEHKDKALPEDTSPLMEVLHERIATQESWVTCLAREYQSKMAPELKLAAWEGENPHERVKQGLSEMSSRIQTARRAVKTAQRSLEDAQEDRDDEARLYAEQQLSKANGDIKKLQQQELKLWRDVYRLTAVAFPELPSEALNLCTTSIDGTGTLLLCDPHAARLLAPTRQKDMYQGPDGELGPVIISFAGKDSKNDVFRAVYVGSDVCLKKFVIGRISKGGTHEELHVCVRTLQREINNVVKLAHDRVIKPALFFLQSEVSSSSS